MALCKIHKSLSFSLYFVFSFFFALNLVLSLGFYWLSMSSVSLNSKIFVLEYWNRVHDSHNICSTNIEHFLFFFFGYCVLNCSWPFFPSRSFGSHIKNICTSCIAVYRLKHTYWKPSPQWINGKWFYNEYKKSAQMLYYNIKIQTYRNVYIIYIYKYVCTEQWNE